MGAAVPTPMGCDHVSVLVMLLKQGKWRLEIDDIIDEKATDAACRRWYTTCHRCSGRLWTRDEVDARGCDNCGWTCNGADLCACEACRFMEAEVQREAALLRSRVVGALDLSIDQLQQLGWT